MRHGHPIRQFLRARLGVDLVRLPIDWPPTTTKLQRRMDYFRRRLAAIKDVPGAIVECGVYRGDSLVLLGVASKLDGPARDVWGFDSFQGLPAPAAQDTTPRASEGRMDRTSVALVTSKLAQAGVKATIVQGFFETTIDAAPDGIALLHLDVDLYDSYRLCFAQLLPKMAPGGVVLFDEYDDPAWPGATQAIRESGLTVERDPCGKHYALVTGPRVSTATP